MSKHVDPEIEEAFAEFDEAVDEIFVSGQRAQNDHPLHPDDGGSLFHESDDEGCLFTIAYLLVLAGSITSMVIL